MQFQKGQSVKVKKGVSCPDDPSVDLSGWQGRIVGIQKDQNKNKLLEIAWDSATLKDMPESYIKSSATDGLDWASIYLFSSDVEQAPPRDSVEDVKKIEEMLNARFHWLGMGEEGERIFEIVEAVEGNDDRDHMQAWGRHLTQHLQFPFESIVDEHQSKGRFKQGDKLKVHGIETVDEFYGVLVACKARFRQYHFPLVDLAATDEDSENAELIQAYRTWFSNRYFDSSD